MSVNIQEAPVRQDPVRRTLYIVWVDSSDRARLIGARTAKSDAFKLAETTVSDVADHESVYVYRLFVDEPNKGPEVLARMRRCTVESD